MPTDIEDKKATFALEVWKKTIDVQQHFNTIEMQIRNFAITVLTATIGAAGVVFNQLQQSIREAVKAGEQAPAVNTIFLFGAGFSASDMIIFAGMLAWVSFYFMDLWWYHRLLQGAVTHAQHIENDMKNTQHGDIMMLSNAIREASHFKLFGIDMKSNRRINIFYGIGVLFQLLLIIFAF
jgi:hypothetical protein